MRYKRPHKKFAGRQRSLVNQYCAPIEMLEDRLMLSAVRTQIAALSGADTTISSGYLAADASGDIYGTVDPAGNISTHPGSDDGSLFKIAAGTHAFSTLAEFTGLNGSYPNGLTFDASGNLFGTTQQGGDLSLDEGYGVGTLFEIPAGSDQLITLLNFNSTNGARPYGRLVADAAGNLYGTTQEGGIFNYGTLFEIAAGSHVLTTLVNFNRTNGSYPQASLTSDAAGNLYGRTDSGGDLSLNDGLGLGTIFEFQPSTNTFSTLLNFNVSDSRFEQNAGSITSDANGNLFGATPELFDNSDKVISYGTVFELPHGAQEIDTFAEFDGTDGSEPGTLIIDSSGNLYGTGNGFGQNYSSVFEIDRTTHKITRLTRFIPPYSVYPTPALISDANGNLFSATELAVFELQGSGFVPRPAPTIYTQPQNQSSVIGQSVQLVADATGDPTPKVQWQASHDGGQTFHDITDSPTATTDTLTVTGVQRGDNQTEYRAVFTNSAGTATSESAMLSIVPAITLTLPAHASPHVTPFTATRLTVLGDTPSGESGLIYTWSLIKRPAGAPPPIFSANGSNAAKQVIATFRKDGHYLFRCTISDAFGHALRSDVLVDVAEQATSLRITPHAQTIRTKQKIQYHAIAYDQFGHPMRTQPTFTYSIVRGPGTIDPNTGILTASTDTGALLIEADDGSLTADAGAKVVL